MEETSQKFFASPDGLRADARRFVRAPIAATVTYVVGEAGPQTGEANDIGGGGIRLAMPAEVGPGTVVLLSFRLPHGDREIVARGKTVMSFYNGQAQKYMHGIAFTQIDPADQAAIVAFVESAIAR